MILREIKSFPISRMPGNSTDQDSHVYEYCAVCGKKTIYTRNIPIQKRSCYIQGAGQLCEDCYMELYQEPCLILQKTNTDGDK